MDNLKKYMKDNFNITPQNIDKKLEEKRRELREKIEIMEGKEWKHQSLALGK